MNSLIRYDKSHYTSDFIKDNPIPDIDNEKPTKEDLKRRLQQIKSFQAPNLQEISEMTKTEVLEQRELTLVQTENILTQIFHNKSFQMFITYPDDQQLANYSQYIPYPMCFTLILARFYQNMSKHIDIKIINDIDYLDKPQAEYYAQLKKYLINNRKQSNSQIAIQNLQSNSLSDAYKKIFGNLPQNQYVNHYVYLDELLADLLQIGINCCSYNRQSQQFRDIGFQLIKTVINSFKIYDFPAFYQFKLKNFTDEEIKAIIESQQQYKKQMTQDEMTTLQSTIMPQLQESTVVQSTIIGAVADSVATSGVLGTNQQSQQNTKVHFSDNVQTQNQNSGDMKVADLITDVNNGGSKEDLVKTVQDQLEQVNQNLWQDDEKFMEMTNYGEFESLDKNQLQETQKYIQEHFM